MGYYIYMHSTDMGYYIYMHSTYKGHFAKFHAMDISMFFLQIFDASYSLDMEHMSQAIILESSTLVWILKIQNVYD